MPMPVGALHSAPMTAFALTPRAAAWQPLTGRPGLACLKRDRHAGSVPAADALITSEESHTG